MIGPKKKIWGIWFETSERYRGFSSRWCEDDRFSGDKILFDSYKEITRQLQDRKNRFPQATYILQPFKKNKI